MTRSPHGSDADVLDGLGETLAACRKELDAFDATLKALGELGAERAAICLPERGPRGTELVVRLSIGMEAASNKILGASRPGVTAVRAAFAGNTLVDAADYSAGPWVATDLEERLGVAGALAVPIRAPETGEAIGVILVVPGPCAAAPRRLGEVTELAAARLARVLPSVRPQGMAAAPRLMATATSWSGAMQAAIEECLQITDLDTLSQRVLDHGRALTGAEFGFVGYIEPATGFLVTPTMTRDIFEQCRVAGKTVVFEKPGGLGGWVVDHKEAVVANDPFSHSGSVGTPPGHLPIRRFLGVPALFRGELRGMIALANKEADFDGEDLGVASVFAGIYAAAVARHFSEVSLLQSRNRYSQLFDEAPCGYLTLAPDGRVLEANDTIQRLLGYAHDEMLDGMARDRLVSAADLPAVDAQLARAKEAGTAGPVEVRYLRKGGEPLHLLQSIRLERDGRGFLQAIRCTLVDVTDLRKVNRAMKTLSACNEALVHAREEGELLATMCQEIVTIGQYPYAWVSYVLADGGIDVRASSGMPCLCVRGADGESLSPAALAVVRTAVAQDRPQIEHALLAPGPAGAGHCALIALPLRAPDGASFGALAILAPEADAFDEAENKLLRELAGDLSYGIGALRAEAERSSSQELIKRSLENTIQAVAATVEMRDPYTAGHQRRVGALAEALAREMGLDDDEVHGIHLAAIIHDIGKIYVPAEILSRPGRLSPVELDLIRTHPQVGYDIIRHIEFPWPVAEMILQHHEKLDGSGYPQGLKGEAICRGARIIAVADIVEAMASHRPYRPGLGLEQALAEIEGEAGRTLDPAAVRACLALFRDKGYRMPA